MEIVLYIAALTFIVYFIARIISFVLSRKHKCVKLKPKSPSSGYRLIYSDQKSVNKEQDSAVYGLILTCESMGISGKPDYVYRHKNGEILIVELKSGEIGEGIEPYNGDLMQLASYFAIAEEHFGEKPREGLIIYKDYMFKVKNTARLRRMLKSVLHEMRDMLKHGEANPAASFVKCKNCICKGTVCEYTD